MEVDDLTYSKIKVRSFQYMRFQNQQTYRIGPPHATWENFVEYT